MDFGIRDMILFIKELFREMERDVGGVMIALIVIAVPTIFSILLSCCLRKKSRNSNANPYNLSAQYRPMLILVIITIVGYGAFRYTHPYPPNFYKLLGGSPAMPSSKPLKRICHQLNENSMTSEQEHACYTFERRVRRKLYDRIGPDYLKCETCSDEWSYFVNTHLGYMLWVALYIPFVLAIIYSSNKMSALALPLYVLAFFVALGQFLLFTILEPIHLYGFVNFEIAYFLLDMLCLTSIIFIIHRHFSGGDHRTNHDIIININKLNRKIDTLSILLLLPEKTTFMTQGASSKQSNSSRSELYKGQDRFISRLYQGDHLAQAYLYALNEVAGSKMIEAEEKKS